MVELDKQVVERPRLALHVCDDRGDDLGRQTADWEERVLGTFEV
jgi:hypothetical protein